jgi:hypothetical protein
VKISDVQRNGAVKHYGIVQVGDFGEEPTNLHCKYLAHDDILHRTSALGSLFATQSRTFRLYTWIASIGL